MNRVHLARIGHQFLTFAGVGLLAAVAHYSVLIGLVELAKVAPVPATLAGYVVGGFVSYVLNRRHTFGSDRPHVEATWRFVAVASVGFCLTWFFMELLVGRWGAPYLPAQIFTTGVVLLWSFLANKLWTFGVRRTDVPPLS